MILATAASILTLTAVQPEGFVDYELRPIRAEAEALRPLVTSDELGLFLDEVTNLQPIIPRSVYYRMGADPAAYRSDEMDSVSDEEKGTLRSYDITTSNYYSTFYGSTLVYARPLDLVIEAGLGTFDDTKIVDMGYGAIMHLKLLGFCGADVTGIEIMPILRAMYSHEGDQGEVTGASGRTGSVRLVHGYWPAGDGIKEDVGDGYDLFISRNTLKRGYVNPQHPIADRQRVKLGVSDDAFLATLHETVAPGGFVVIYNIGLGEAGEGESYNPAADIANPWPQEAWEGAGFEIVAFDVNDDEMTRHIAKALKQDLDLERLHGQYTIARRPE